MSQRVNATTQTKNRISSAWFRLLQCRNVVGDSRTFFALPAEISCRLYSGRHEPLDQHASVNAEAPVLILGGAKLKLEELTPGTALLIDAQPRLKKSPTPTNDLRA